MTAVRHVNHPRGIREQHLIKELCGRSGIMGYVTFHHKTRRAPLMVALTWETAAVIFLTTAARRGEPSEIHRVDAPESAARRSPLVCLFVHFDESFKVSGFCEQACLSRERRWLLLLKDCNMSLSENHFMSWSHSCVSVSFRVTLSLLSVMHCNQCNRSVKFDLYCSNCTL